MKKSRLIAFVLFVILSLVMTACDNNREVPENEIRAKLNPSYDPRTDPITAKYTEIKGAKEEYDSSDTGFITLSATDIQAPNIGIYGTQYLPPGHYAVIPSVDVQIVSGTQVPADYVGVYLDTTVSPQEYRVLPSGVHYVPAEWVSLYPTSVQRYRTLGGSAWESYKAGDNSPCISLVCEFSITSVGIAGTNIQASVDVDIQFRFCQEQRCAKRLTELGSPEQAVQNWVATPLRSYVRGGFAYTAEELSTNEVRQELQATILSYLQSANASEPIIFEAVSIRSIVIGSDEYRLELERAASELEALKRQGDLLAQQQANQQAQLNMTATASAFDRDQQALNAEAQAAALGTLLSVLSDANVTLDWQTVMALLNADNPNWLSMYASPYQGTVQPPVATPQP